MSEILRWTINGKLLETSQDAPIELEPDGLTKDEKFHSAALGISDLSAIFGDVMTVACIATGNPTSSLVWLSFKTLCKDISKRLERDLPPPTPTQTRF